MTGLADLVGHPRGRPVRQGRPAGHESEIFERYRDEVVARSGVRFHGDGPLHDGYTPESAMVFLDRDITFTVELRPKARSFAGKLT